MNNNFYSVYFVKKFTNWSPTHSYIFDFPVWCLTPRMELHKNILPLKDKISLNFFINKSLTDDIFNKTLAFNFILKFSQILNLH